MFFEFIVKTNNRTDFVDITVKISEVVKKSGIKEGICHVFVPHTTAGITINENADPAVVSDLKKIYDSIVPWKNNYLHSEGNSAAHAKASLTGFSINLIIKDSRILFGTWQGVYFAEFDGPRTRKVFIKIT